MKTLLYFVYILTNKSHVNLYIGVTNNLKRRCEEHRSAVSNGFTSKYKINKLIYFETFKYINDAIRREKHIKSYSGIKKDNLIDAFNPERQNLFVDGEIIPIPNII